ncbi:hypothetical protein AXY37_03710 [Mammaliicoccus lentus]|uniref:AbrB/MazE/SpoVT family DNA-binding domain-containing protein n=1 Tax=Mammaliicoccus lentus TaxID=42858 RepID=A0AAX3W399_MAMLE|nr:MULTISPECIES: AbrB/MazE/SpoVT family DNA-binding domain-containing protein [Mammaliicoccus]MBF0749376.1 AbrB/MazE/SpoVT family DNA-binding domain-containing protein [Mammaliicoccus lentus]MBF0794952.1 AbrB/MazE/SpoVT family DNA-binding domain-containing protein [Mammaliicoccus lentus]MBW0763157.1 AbrB/MazE/SpoVT family DNA-binding domain-containing protein [Mammaliicoccus lentus]MBW0771146.1 AbrB/MazE/SpoVT family DNA-binding domain-containing protein [Mammaliicoccus lentus]MCD2477589.1 Abr
MEILNVKKIRKVGNSSVITIPKNVMEAINIHEGDAVEFIEEDNKIWLKPSKSINEHDDILKLADEISNKYDDVFKGLVDR